MEYNKSCVIYHGFGSKPTLSRTQLLNKYGFAVISEYFDYAKEWDLDRGKSLFERELKKIDKVDMILGISFGGYLAYKLSKATGINALLINPSLNRWKSKSPIKEFDIPEFNNKSDIEIFFGEKDTSVLKEYTVGYLSEMEEEYLYHDVKDMAHRIPDNYFKLIIKNSQIIKKLKIYENNR